VVVSARQRAPRFGTLEFRVLDVATRAEETVALAALAQAIVVKLHKLYTRNMGFRLYRRALIDENKWRAARYGLDGWEALDGRLVIIEQTLLPHEEREVELATPEEVSDAIYRLAVRGAPAIGAAAASSTRRDTTSAKSRAKKGGHMKAAAATPSLESEIARSARM